MVAFLFLMCNIHFRQTTQKIGAGFWQTGLEIKKEKTESETFKSGFFGENFSLLRFSISDYTHMYKVSMFIFRENKTGFKKRRRKRRSKGKKEEIWKKKEKKEGRVFEEKNSLKKKREQRQGW